MTSTGSRICTLIVEIQDAFLSTPDLTLSPIDAVRRFGADHLTCEAILDALVDARVLTPAKDGAYESAFPQLHPHLQSHRGESPDPTPCDGSSMGSGASLAKPHTTRPDLTNEVESPHYRSV